MDTPPHSASTHFSSAAAAASAAGGHDRSCRTPSTPSWSPTTPTQSSSSSGRPREPIIRGSIGDTSVGTSSSSVDRSLDRKMAAYGGVKMMLPGKYNGCRPSESSDSSSSSIFDALPGSKAGHGYVQLPPAEAYVAGGAGGGGEGTKQPRPMPKALMPKDARRPSCQQPLQPQLPLPGPGRGACSPLLAPALQPLRRSSVAGYPLTQTSSTVRPVGAESGRSSPRTADVIVPAFSSSSMLSSSRPAELDTIRPPPRRGLESTGKRFVVHEPNAGMLMLRQQRADREASASGHNTDDDNDEEVFPVRASTTAAATPSGGNVILRRKPGDDGGPEMMSRPIGGGGGRRSSFADSRSFFAMAAPEDGGPRQKVMPARPSYMPKPSKYLMFNSLADANIDDVSKKSGARTTTTTTVDDDGCAGQPPTWRRNNQQDVTSSGPAKQHEVVIQRERGGSIGSFRPEERLSRKTGDSATLSDARTSPSAVRPTSWYQPSRRPLTDVNVTTSTTSSRTSPPDDDTRLSPCIVIEPPPMTTTEPKHETQLAGNNDTEEELEEGGGGAAVRDIVHESSPKKDDDHAGTGTPASSSVGGSGDVEYALFGVRLTPHVSVDDSCTRSPDSTEADVSRNSTPDDQRALHSSSLSLSNVIETERWTTPSTTLLTIDPSPITVTNITNVEQSPPPSSSPSSSSPRSSDPQQPMSATGRQHNDDESRTSTTDETLPSGGTTVSSEDNDDPPPPPLPVSLPPLPGNDADDFSCHSSFDSTAAKIFDDYDGEELRREYPDDDDDDNETVRGGWTGNSVQPGGISTGMADWYWRTTTGGRPQPYHRPTDSTVTADSGLMSGHEDNAWSSADDELDVGDAVVGQRIISGSGSTTTTTTTRSRSPLVLTTVARTPDSLTSPTSSDVATTDSDLDDCRTRLSHEFQPNSSEVTDDDVTAPSDVGDVNVIGSLNVPDVVVTVPPPPTTCGVLMSQLLAEHGKTVADLEQRMASATENRHDESATKTAATTMTKTSGTVSSEDPQFRNQITDSITCSSATDDAVNQRKLVARPPEVVVSCSGAEVQLTSTSINSTGTGKTEASDVDGGQGKRTVDVTVVKSSLGLGFCIEGGVGSATGDRPVSVKRLFRKSEELGDLKAGDEIVSVNGVAFDRLSHYEAWNKLKSLPDGSIVLSIRR